MSRTALVTGASAGIGEATASRLAALGYRVVGTSRMASCDVPIATSGVTMTQLDVCDAASVKLLKIKLEREGAMPDLIVLNAGFGISGPIEETSTELVISQFDTNMFGVHRVVRAFLPAMRQKRRGQIIVIGSILGRVTLPFQAFYSASKAAAACYAESLRMEVEKFGIKVSLIEPGDHKSDFGAGRIEAVAPQDSGYEPQGTRAVAIMEENEMKGPPPSRVADLVTKIASERAPKFRYLQVQFNERQILWLKAFVTEGMFEKFVLKALKMSKPKT